jgi:hypothetical protein
MAVSGQQTFVAGYRPEQLRSFNVGVDKTFGEHIFGALAYDDMTMGMVHRVDHLDEKEVHIIRGDINHFQAIGASNLPVQQSVTSTGKVEKKFVFKDMVASNVNQRSGTNSKEMEKIQKQAMLMRKTYDLNYLFFKGNPVNPVRWKTYDVNGQEATQYASQANIAGTYYRIDNPTEYMLNTNLKIQGSQLNLAMTSISSSTLAYFKYYITLARLTMGQAFGAENLGTGIEAFMPAAFFLKLNLAASQAGINAAFEITKDPLQRSVVELQGIRLRECGKQNAGLDGTQTESNIGLYETSTGTDGTAGTDAYSSIVLVNTGWNSQSETHETDISKNGLFAVDEKDFVTKWDTKLYDQFYEGYTASLGYSSTSPRCISRIYGIAVDTTDYLM